MTLQVTLGKDALIALGVGVSDVVTLYSLGRRFGNWITATEEDKKLFKLLDCDELEVLRRQGLIDVKAFNQKWGESISLLVDGKPQQSSDPKVLELLKDLTRFTASMLTVVAVLDTFMLASDVKVVMRSLLVELFSVTSDNELILSTEIDARINAWRSAACVRGLHLEAREIRREFIRKGLVQDGMVPESECHEIVTFLSWLFASSTDEMTTPSSDTAAMGACLSRMVFDILWVRWPGDEEVIAPCILIYDASVPILRSPRWQLKTTAANYSLEGLSAWRSPSTKVPVDYPEESMSSFPVSHEWNNHFRLAWKSGAAAGEVITFRLEVPIQKDIDDGNDLRYEVIDHGTPVGRINDVVFTLVKMHAYHSNNEICKALERLLEHEKPDDLQWLVQQYTDAPSWTWRVTPADNHLSAERMGPELTSEHEMTSLHIQDERLSDSHKIFLFTLVQAFFLGYHYSLVFRLVDTRLLLDRVVDGAFYYRSPTLLMYIRSFLGTLLKPHATQQRSGKQIGRQSLLQLLPTLLFSLRVQVDFTQRDKWLMGMIGKRALLAKSLLSPTVTPNDIAKLVLLDTDVSNIPCSRSGAVVAGSPRLVTWDVDSTKVDQPSRRVEDQGPDEDFTLHIEADWDVNPEYLVICARYKGRRVGTYQPLIAEKLFLMAYVPPVEHPRAQVLDEAIPCSLGDIMEAKMDFNTRYPLLVLAKGRPAMRYAVVALSNSTVCKVASNCLQTAAEQIPEVLNNIRLQGIVVGCEQ